MSHHHFSGRPTTKGNCNIKDSVKLPSIFTSSSLPKISSSEENVSTLHENINDSDSSSSPYGSIKLPPIFNVSYDSWDGISSSHSSFSLGEGSTKSCNSLSSKSSRNGDLFTVPAIRIRQFEKSTNYKRPNSPSDSVQVSNLLKKSLTAKLSASRLWDTEVETISSFDEDFFSRENSSILFGDKLRGRQSSYSLSIEYMNDFADEEN